MEQPSSRLEILHLFSIDDSFLTPLAPIQMKVQKRNAKPVGGHMEETKPIEIELEIEELEEVIAPGRKMNHSETLVGDAEDIELEMEELEEVIAPRRIIGPQE
jgi:hypothetical protein